MALALTSHSFDRLTERHATLLTALLADAPLARTAAHRWLDTVDFDDIDVGEQRLMPLLDSRLRELGIDHPTNGRVRGLYRRAWYVEQMMRHQLGEVMKIIGEVTSEAVLLKGAALGRLVYDRPAHRPYDDFDILVPPGKQAGVIAALQRAGGTICPPWFHATMVRLPSGLSIDIHRSPYHLAFQPEHVKPIFTRLRRIDAATHGADGTPDQPSDAWLTLSATDQFLHTLVHGLFPTSVPPIRWIVDATFQLRRASGQIDWKLFLDEVTRLDFADPAILGLREILRYEPNEDAARVLAELERRASRPALLRWQLDAKEADVVWLWESTRRNASGPVGRLRLIASVFLARHGLAWLLRRIATKGVPLSMALVKARLGRSRRLVRGPG